VTAQARAIVRGVVIALGVLVTIASLFAFHLADWPIYLTFVALSILLFPFEVEVLPGLGLPMPTLAVTVGFLYIAGPAIIVLRVVAPTFLAQFLRFSLPERWRVQLVHALLVHGGPSSPAARIDRPTIAADWATFALGLGSRWAVIQLLSPDGRAVGHPLVMLGGELGGYVCWALLSSLPILSFSPVLPRERDPHRPLFQDLGLIMPLALTPFVFLVTYGYQEHGLAGATAWSLSALSLHFMLQRLTQRRVQVEEQNRRLEALNRELEHRERLSAIGKMSSVVSHQMLQQLGVMGLYADLIRNPPPTSDGGQAADPLADARANAVAIQNALADVNRVLTDLLVFSRDLQLNLYTHRLEALLGECIEACRPAAEARRVRLRLDAPDALDVRIDKLKIKQAVVNLLRNAIDASPPGASVEVRAVATADAVELSVEDEGPGVPTADREAIFAPFFTTREQGTGLGLAIAREFVNAHGGRIWVESRDGRSGARFVIRLPLVSDAAASLPGGGSAADPSRTRTFSERG